MRYSCLSFSSLKFLTLSAVLLLCTACSDTFNHCVYGLSEGVSQVNGVVLCAENVEVPYKLHDDGYWTNPQPISTQCESVNIEIELTNGNTLVEPAKYLSGIGEKSTDYDKYGIERDGTLVRTHASWRSGLKTCPAADIAKFKWEYEWASDTYGIGEAEKTGRQPDRLLDCSESENCPEQAQALFWVAVDAFSEAMNEPARETTKFSTGTPIEEIAVTLANDFSQSSRESPPNYDLDSPEYKRGFELMNKAHTLGNAYASNELGVLFMTQAKMQDLSLAKTYFNVAFERGDAYGAYNLARITRLENPDAHSVILTHLKKATTSKQRHFEQIYNLGLEAFGTDEEKRAASKYFNQKDDSTGLPVPVVPSDVRKDFEAHFGLNGTQDVE